MLHTPALEEHKSLKVAHSLKKASLNSSNITKTSTQHALSKLDYWFIFSVITWKLISQLLLAHFATILKMCSCNSFKCMPVTRAGHSVL